MNGPIQAPLQLGKDKSELTFVEVEENSPKLLGRICFKHQNTQWQDIFKVHSVQIKEIKKNKNIVHTIGVNRFENSADEISTVYRSPCLAIPHVKFWPRYDTQPIILYSFCDHIG